MNVILIMVDSLRKDHLGCYGNTWIKTPNLDSFAKKSVIFENAYAENLPTLPVRTAILTGKYTLMSRGWQPLDPSDVTIAEYLWDKGITTAMISDTYHMHKPGMNFMRGFDYVEWIRGQEYDPYIVDSSIKVHPERFNPKNWKPLFRLDLGKHMRSEENKKLFEQYLRNRAHWKSEEDHFIAQVVKRSIKWLEEKVKEGRRDHLFLYVDCFDPHEPWDPPPPYSEMYPVPEYDDLPLIQGGGTIEEFTLAEIRYQRAQYAGEVSLVDRWLGIFFEKIEELAIYDNTLVIFLSDHGEPLGEHGILRKIKPWPYEELSHIPLIMRFPDGMVKPHRTDVFVHTPDIMPTILDFLGIEIPHFVRGQSLIPIINKEKEPDFKVGISGFFRYSWSIRNGEWSFYLWNKRLTKDQPQLYHYDSKYVPPEPKEFEPLIHQAERENVINEYKDVAENMELELRRILEDIGC